MDLHVHIHHHDDDDDVTRRLDLILARLTPRDRPQRPVLEWTIGPISEQPTK